MKCKFFNKVFLLALLVLFSFSCSSDLDFEQAKDFNIQPAFTTNLAYLKGEAPDFVVNGIEKPTFAYNANVEFFNTSFVQEDLVKAELFFRVKNTINRAYVFNISFLDTSSSMSGVIRNIRIDVPAAVNGAEVLVNQTVVFEGAQVDVLKRTTNMVFSVTMLPGPPLTESSPGRVELSSSITAYFNVE